MISIRSVLVFGFCGLLGLAVIAVGLVGVGGAFDNTFVLIARDAVSLVDDADQRLQEELQPIEDQARYIESRFATGDLSFDDPDRLVLALESSTAPIPDLGGMLLVDANGVGYRWVGRRRIDAVPEITTGNFGDIYPEYSLGTIIEMARETEGSVWRRPAWIAELGQTIINLHTSLWRDGQFLGVLVQGKTVADLSVRLRSIQRGTSAVPFLLYNDSHVLAHPILGFVNLDVSLEEPLPSLQEFSDPVLGGYAEREPMRIDQDDITASIDLAQVDMANGWFMFATRDISNIAADRPITVGFYFDEDHYQEVWNRLLRMSAVAVVVLVLSVLAALYVSKATMRPIQALADASQIVANGDLENVPVFPRTRMRELAEAAAAFREMVAGLKERERIMDLFGRVVPHKVAERMLQSPEDLAPQTVTATVLFCDLEGFTRMTEELGPERVIAVLNAYFTDMVDIVHEQDGIVTQFQGDAILAVFNLPLADPDHAQKAVLAARTMRAHLRDRDYGGRKLRNRIGIATGPMIAANVGAETRMNYTVHGDTVNLASRLENMNKEYQTDILIADTTAGLLHDIPIQKLGSVQVRGRDAPAEVYTLQDT
ncbi:MAG: adenylate/guanylate cyclase domain-containing protein [Alphaproteobacteria bacterium]